MRNTVSTSPAGWVPHDPGHQRGEESRGLQMELSPQDLQALTKGIDAELWQPALKN